MVDAFCGKRSLRAALVLVGIAGFLLAAAPAGARARQAPAQSEPSSGDPYADLLVTTATSELRLPWQSLPPVLSVLGTKAATRQATLAFLQAAQAHDAAEAQALRAAYAAAVEAAARQGPAASAAVRRAASRCGGDFDCFKACTLEIESHGNYGAVSPGGKYRGAWQFDQSTWDGAVARAGYPEWSGHDPATAPPGVQDAAARQLYTERGNQPWGGRC